VGKEAAVRSVRGLWSRRKGAVAQYVEAAVAGGRGKCNDIIRGYIFSFQFWYWNSFFFRSMPKLDRNCGDSGLFGIHLYDLSKTMLLEIISLDEFLVCEKTAEINCVDS
jgi:hypothetical protein